MRDTKTYKKQWYENNKNRIIAKTKDHYYKKRALVSQLKDKPCADCGKKYIAEAMEFDYIDQKSKKFRLVMCNRSIENIVAEAEKCVIVCANCHRIRNQTRKNSSVKTTTKKQEYVPQMVSRSQDLAAYQREKNKKSYYKHRDARNIAIANYKKAQQELVRSLKNKPCADCGVQYGSEVMEFDHIDPSTKKFSLANARTSLENILIEAAKCDVVCANCHRIRTSIRRKNNLAPVA